MLLQQVRHCSSAIRTRNANVRKYLEKQFQDAYAKLAREHSFRARSAFKLLEIHERFKIFKPGFNVLDIGAAPGSWSQIAQMHVQPDGYVLGVDLQFIQPLEGVEFLQRADITDPQVQEAISQRLGERKIDCVISDMAPNPSGSKETDHLRIINLCRSVLKFVDPNASPERRVNLSNSAVFLCKIWEGPLREELSQEIHKLFGKVRAYKPNACRDDSAEIYLLSKRINK